MPRIIPNLWFDGNAKEAVDFYVSVFPSSRVTDVTHYATGGPGDGGRSAGDVLTVEFVLDGVPFTAINAGPEFTFSEAVSFAIEVEDQKELDYYWDTLSAGGEEQPCGWLKDRYGLSWQVVPKGWIEIVKDPTRAEAATQAMYGMKRLDIAALEAAGSGG